MQIIRQATELETAGRKVCLAIGMFDGVHLGHQQVLRQTMQDASQHHAISVAITFDRHPNSIVAPERTPPLIYSLPQKLRAIESTGVEATLLLDFTASFSRIPGEDFIRKLHRDFRSIYSICVGSSFTFGHKRSGNVVLLKKLGQELGFSVHGLAAVSLDNQTVSSTRIREAVRSGDLDAASQMLGRAYSLAGVVVQGDRLGRGLGFPTANLETAGLITPPNGVYAVNAHTPTGVYPAVANIGFRPTLEKSSPEKRFEVHIFDFAEELYGQEIEISFVAFLRGEQRFASIEELKSQIERDILEAQRVF